MMLRNIEYIRKNSVVVCVCANAIKIGETPTKAKLLHSSIRKPTTFSYCVKL